MIARLLVAPGLEGAAHARWTAATLLDVTACAWRDAAAGGDDADDAGDAAGGAAGPVVFVGPQAAAPADAAVVLPWEGLAPWPPQTLALATVDGVTLPVPGGRVDPPPAPTVLPAPWLRGAYALLSREEERLVTARDVWNCFAGTASRLSALGALERPLLNGFAARLETLLHAWAERHGGRLVARP